MDTMRPENISSLHSSIRTTQFFDLSGFKQKQEFISFPNEEYLIPKGGAVKQMTITVPAQQDYLTDVEFWFRLTYTGAQAADKVFTITELCNLIKTITIRVDSRQILYLDYAKHLLSIINQRKGDASQQLSSKVSQSPFQFNRTFTAGAQNVFTDYKDADHHLAARILKPKQWSLYRHLGELAHNYVHINECTADQNTALDGQDRGGNMLVQPDMRFCLFKLSDLGLFRSFPRFLLKRGMEIILELSDTHALQDIKPVEEAKNGATTSIYLTLPK